MKKLSVLAIMFCALFAFSSCEESLTKKLYSGPIVDKLNVPNNYGSPNFFVFFKDSKSGKVLKLRVSHNVYYNYNVGDTVSFNLNDKQLRSNDNY